MERGSNIEGKWHGKTKVVKGMYEGFLVNSEPNGFGKIDY